MNKSSLLPTPPSNESSDDEEENSEKILLHPPSFFSMDEDKGAPACCIINKQLKHLLRHGGHLPQNDPPSSTINQHHLLFRGYMKQVKGRTGGQNKHFLMSTATAWLLR
jgi:hypothetical protein